ncbi:adenylate/guanylate cyclase domain-containing protein [Roseibium alexandrii]|uniref:Adenylate cyclase, family 3 (Some protein containing HAMP domain) n=1 Tax=Roseibium alexandrii (strain DSM 17067 / NCIMB 14079 / DFL-11) TaxID=244592 RepID=A0A5E8H4I6_ROSAD|nr:adenylate/guanylate cyclase domain-containing protein [Roseibium alexandrii]EEE47416.2 Adenylate cyclase, family 3 (some protein containing HAMP domain) [Roseibium alexandrii DFL-11]
MTDPATPSKVPATAADAAWPNPGHGNWRQRLRLWSGLVLFLFCLSHFSNHAMGIISVNAMEKMSLWHYWIWRGPIGETVLITAALTHVALALWRTSKRRTLRMPPWEFAQLVLGLYIPWTLIPHVITTMGLAKEFGFIPNYHQMLTILWPQNAVMQSILLLVVWTHAVIGLHFWLRLYPFYHRIKYMALAAAIAWPVMALWGFVEGARRLALAKDVTVKVSEDQWVWLYAQTDNIRAVVFGLILLSLFVIVVRYLASRVSAGISISYPGGLTVRAQPGASLLEISRMNGIPVASVCGGRARCSTCRVKVLNGLDSLSQPNPAETTVLKRIGVPEDVRLACQIRPAANLEIQPLVPVKANLVRQDHVQDAYYWGVEQDVVVMFVDLRNFTSMTEAQLAYDVVFLLNQYLDRVSAVIRAEGGYVDKFIGDGVMAIFGMETGAETGARQALMACRGIEQVMEALNTEKGPQFRDTIRLGVGLHLGQAILGRIGAAGSGKSEGGLTALGDVVNTASRLESENKPRGSFLVVSKDVIDAARATAPDDALCEINVRGKEKPLQVFALGQMSGLLLPGETGAKNPV